MSSRAERKSGPAAGRMVLTFGTIRTGLLLNSGAISQGALPAALRLLPGERVRTSERPIAYGVSAEVLTGVDCTLAAASGAKTRGIGTVATRATITGGRIVQGSTYARLVESDVDYRRPWSHFLGRPGTVETIGKIGATDLARGMMADQRLRPGINLAAICDRILDRVQQSPELDRSPPFRAARTTLRWVMSDDADNAADHLSFTIVNGELRLVDLKLSDQVLPEVLQLCEDLALHDWLLTTLLGIIERSHMDSGELSYMIAKLGPAVDHLLHLWMPGARVDSRLLPLWHSLDKYPGFTKQWETSVSRIRDQLALSTLKLLGHVTEGKAGVHEHGVTR
jgi:hypothetical protein